MGKALDDALEPSKGDKQAAIGAMAIKAGEVFYKALKGLGVEVVVAPTESEHQLCALQEMQLIDVIYTLFMQTTSIT